MSNNPLMRPLFAAILVALLQTAFLGYMIESRASILRNGVDVVLKTVPVDPRDLRRAPSGRAVRGGCLAGKVIDQGFCCLWWAECVPERIVDPVFVRHILTLSKTQPRNS